MSVDYTTIAGRIIQVDKDTRFVPMKLEVVTCPNVECENHGEPLDGNYCSICGTKIRKSEVEVQMSVKELLDDYAYNDENGINKIAEDERLFYSSGSVKSAGVWTMIDLDEVQKVIKEENPELDAFEEFLDKFGIPYKEINGAYTFAW